jgi:hypothetical protein
MPGSKRIAQGDSSGPSFDRVTSIVHEWLIEKGRRPRVSDVAQVFGLTELGLRRFLKKNHAATCREMIAYSCTSFAVERIRDGWKVEASMRAADLRNKTNFCRECRDFFGNLPHELRRKNDRGGALISRVRRASNEGTRSLGLT